MYDLTSTKRNENQDKASIFYILIFTKKQLM